MPCPSSAVLGNSQTLAADVGADLEDPLGYTLTRLLGPGPPQGHRRRNMRRGHARAASLIVEVAWRGGDDPRPRRRNIKVSPRVAEVRAGVVGAGVQGPALAARAAITVDEGRDGRLTSL